MQEREIRSRMTSKYVKKKMVYKVKDITVVPEPNHLIVTLTEVAAIAEIEG